MSFQDIESGYNGRSTGGPRGGAGISYQTSEGDSEYIRTNQDATNNIYEISKRVADIKSMVDILGKSNDTHDHRAALKDLTLNTTNLARKTEQQIKNLANFSGETLMENRQRKIQQQKLAKDFQFVLRKFQDITKVSMEKQRQTVAVERERLQSERIDFQPSGADDSMKWDDSEQASLVAAEKSQQLQYMENQIKYHSDIIAEREEGIKEIEATILEVNDIFQDLGTLVAVQGTQLDNIESNIESTTNRTGAAVGELRSASKYQKKARAKMCWLLFILLCIIAVIVVISVVESRK